MEKFLPTIKESDSSYRIQLDMTSHSYKFPIAIVFLSYESKEPLPLMSKKITYHGLIQATKIPHGCLEYSN